ncbi:MAG TPA: DUF1326 domain-containing protein [Terriglobales bacterium]|nr:DUF1326 domain-containing protein [Terriglobales bacterium]
MKKFIAGMAIGLLVLVSVSAAQQISGDYLETRSADVYTGQCFANGEVGLTGNEAILAWRVDRGSWKGTPLDGLSVVLAVRANATLGDPYGEPYPAKSVIVVDDQATPQQETALVAFAKHMSGKLSDNVERVITAPVAFEVVRQQAHATAALLRAGNFATVQTRSLNDHDHICGNEVTFYPPLTDTTHAMAAVAVRDEYKGPGLGETWSVSDKRSAFVGTFAR